MNFEVIASKIFKILHFKEKFSCVLTLILPNNLSCWKNDNNTYCHLQLTLAPGIHFPCCHPSSVFILVLGFLQVYIILSSSKTSTNKRQLELFIFTCTCTHIYSAF